MTFTTDYAEHGSPTKEVCATRTVYSIHACTTVLLFNLLNTCIVFKAKHLSDCTFRFLLSLGLVVEDEPFEHEARIRISNLSLIVPN